MTYAGGNNTFYVVNDTHESRDFEMSAGLVSVSGNVTDILGASTKAGRSDSYSVPSKWNCT